MVNTKYIWKTCHDYSKTLFQNLDGWMGEVQGEGQELMEKYTSFKDLSHIISPAFPQFVKGYS